MQDTYWIDTLTQVEEQLLTAIRTVVGLREEMRLLEARFQNTQQQLVIDTDESAVEVPQRRAVPQVGRGKHHWTDFETDRMVSMWMRGIPTAIIASELERTERAISDHARSLRAEGLALPKRDGIVRGNR